MFLNNLAVSRIRILTGRQQYSVPNKVKFMSNTQLKLLDMQKSRKKISTMRRKSNQPDPELNK